MATAAAAPQITAGFHTLDIDAIESSGLNPRTHWNDVDDQELQESIRTEGVLEPILVRAHPTKLERFQVVAGERRFRAANAVGLGLMPAIVRDVTDEKLLDLALTENIQRRSMHPLDEANGFIKRLEMGKSSPEALANALGLSKRYVSDRIRLTKLVPAAAKMLETGEMSVSHAIALAKLDPKLQAQALDDNSDWEFDYDAPKAEQKKRVLYPVAELKDWIARNVPIDPASPEAQEEFPQLAEASTEAAAKGATVVMLSTDRTPYQHKAKPDDPLFADRWQPCKKTDKAAQIGVVVEGRRQGERVYFKPVAPPKPSSNSTSSTSSSSGLSAAEKKKNEERNKRERAAENRRRELSRQWNTLKPKAIAALGDHVKAMSMKAVLAVVTKRERVTHDGTADGFVRALAVQTASRADYSPDSFSHSTKALGFDVKKWMKTQAAIAKKAAVAKKAKKR